MLSRIIIFTQADLELVMEVYYTPEAHGDGLNFFPTIDSLLTIATIKDGCI